MLKTIVTLGLLLAAVVGGALFFLDTTTTTTADDKKMTESIHKFDLRDIDGNPVKLDRYQGKVALLVNVASKCGYTAQYEGLQKIHDQYKERGFVVLGVPANNFGGQEPGTNEEIKEFCTTRYKTTFPMFAKISVKGDDQDPLYKFLTSKETNPEFGGDISWNFNKFLVDREGRIIARFSSKDTPESATVTTAIEKALANKSQN